MRDKIYLVLLWVGLSLSFGYAQQDTQKVTEEESHRMGQDLIDMLQTGRYFEAKSLYDTIRIKVDSIHPFIENLYRMYISSFENKPDSVAFYLEEMIKKRFFPDILYMKVYGIYVEQLQDYKKAEQTLDRVRSYLEHNPDSINAEEMKVVCDHLADSESRTMRRAAEPTIRIVRDDTGSSTPLLADKILNDNYLFFNVSYNGHQPIRTLFDTGVSEYLIMDKAIAEQVGVRKYPVYENDTTCTVNGMKVPGYLGILDSLQIGDIKLYHIPVEVIDAKSIIH
ncbi:MAG: aspartyl protease family protein [Tannerella sp.]|uniref:aspartyl protease family protein n=1 Tax=Tannerella sp. TaxID=2382127 RepID=UPI003FA1F72C